MASPAPLWLAMGGPGHLPPGTGGLAALHSHGTAPAKEVVLALFPPHPPFSTAQRFGSVAQEGVAPARLLHPGLDPLELGWLPGAPA